MVFHMWIGGITYPALCSYICILYHKLSVYTYIYICVSVSNVLCRNTEPLITYKGQQYNEYSMSPRKVNL